MLSNQEINVAEKSEASGVGRNSREGTKVPNKEKSPDFPHSNFRLG